MSSDQFDSVDVFADAGENNSSSGKKDRPGTCGWHWQLTLLSLLLVSGLSFLMAYLTRDIVERPIWLMGLIFMIPVGAMFFSAMALEFAQGAMTPSVSRKTQMKVAALATAATFLVASACDAVYLYGGYVADSADNLIFLVYENDTSGNSSTDRAMMQVFDELYKKAGERVDVGLFMFDFSNQDTYEKKDAVVPLAPFSSEQRDAVYRTLIEGEKNNMTGYGHDMAYEMVEASKTTKATRIIIVTDSGILYGNGKYTLAEWKRDVDRLKKDNISLFFMGRGDPDEGMYYVVENTGGKVVTGYDAGNVLENLQKLARADGDMVRSDTHSSVVLTGIMMALEGLTAGLGLMLLLSVKGQKRFQAVLSPLMAVLAFLLLKILPHGDIPQWIVEGVAFSLLGLVFMARNYPPGTKVPSPAKTDPVDTVIAVPDDWE